MYELKITAASADELTQEVVDLARKLGRPIALEVTVGAGGAGGADVGATVITGGGAGGGTKSNKGASGKTVEEAAAQPPVEGTIVVQEKAPEVDPDAPPLTYEDHVKPAVLRLSMNTNRETVLKVLNAFGGKGSAKGIAEDKWPALLAMVDTEMAAFDHKAPA